MNKKIIVGVVVIVALLIGVKVGLGIHAQRKIDSQLQDAKIFIEDVFQASSNWDPKPFMTHAGPMLGFDAQDGKVERLFNEWAEQFGTLTSYDASEIIDHSTVGGQIRQVILHSHVTFKKGSGTFKVRLIRVRSENVWKIEEFIPIV